MDKHNYVLHVFMFYNMFDMLLFSRTALDDYRQQRGGEDAAYAKCNVYIYIYIYIYRSLGVVSDKIASAKRNPVQTGNTTTTPPTTTTTTTTNNNNDKGR